MVRPHRQDKRKTIDAVAAAAGVSTMTVSRVMRGKTNVAAKTRDRVLAAAQDLGYVYNRLAGALASAHSAQIAVILPSMRNIIFPEVLTGVTDALEGTGFQPVIGITDYDLSRERDLVLAMLSWRPAGVILAGAHRHEDVRRVLERGDIPVVETMEMNPAPIDICVGIDQRRVGRETARHMLARGRRRFAYLGADHALDLTARARFDGFRTELLAGGGRLDHVVTAPEPSGVSLGRTHVEPLLDLGDALDAIYFSNDAVAAGAMMASLRRGVRIPEDLAFFGFGGLEIAEAMPVKISTMRSPRYEMGRISAQLILDRLAGVEVLKSFDPGFELIAGESC